MDTTLPTTLEVNEFIDSYHTLSSLTFAGIDLSYSVDFGFDLLDTFISQTGLSESMKKYLISDEIFKKYLPSKEEYQTKDFFVGIEGIVSDSFNAICNFFKKLVQSIKDFISKLFNMIFNITRTNENNLHKLHTIFKTKQSDLGKITASSNIPESLLVIDTFTNCKDVIDLLMKFDLSKLEHQVIAALDDKINPDQITETLNYERVLGKSYIELLSKIGISFGDDNLAIFETVFKSRTDTSTIHDLGYSYETLLDINKILTRHLTPMKQRMDILSKVLDKITVNLNKLKLKITSDHVDQKSEYILKTLPKDITKLIGIYQKVSLAILTYEMKFSEILVSLAKDLK